jgi:hypothetical protein
MSQHSGSEAAADKLAARASEPTVIVSALPDAEAILAGIGAAPEISGPNIFPMRWRVDTPKLYEIYDAARDPGWAPNRLPWESLDVTSFSQDERYAIAYWFTLLSVFDASGPAVFARAMIHTYEVQEEDPIRKCFFSVVRDETNHEEVCGRAIRALTPNGPVDYEPATAWGRLARNNVDWLFHNGARYWSGFKGAIQKYPVPILFTSFLFGEVASSTLFHGMYQRTTIPVFKEAFQRIGQDEGRHLGICLAALQRILPALKKEDKEVITAQLRAGFVFLSGILFEPPEQFWQLPATFLPAHRGLEQIARSAGLGILSYDERRENWRNAVLRLKANLEPHGIRFPALPEIGVDGETVAFDPDKIVPIF